MIGVFRVAMSDEKRQVLGQTISGKDIQDLFVWNSRLITGLAEIDNQHMKLVQLINALHRALRSRLGTNESGKIIDELADYTSCHFDLEETSCFRLLSASCDAYTEPFVPLPPSPQCCL